MTLDAEQGVTGNTGMAWWLILASSRWRRWVRWSAPAGRRPTPGCRSSQRRSSLAPIPDSSPCRWWRRSSQTNLCGGGTNQTIRSHFSAVFRCLAAEAGRSLFPRIHPSAAYWTPFQPFMAFSCFAHLPGLKWPRLCQPLWHFNLGSGQRAQCHPCFGWVGTWVWHSTAGRPGTLQRAAKRGHNGLAVEPLSGWKGMKYNGQVEH